MANGVGIMRGLCGYHRAQVARSADVARVYWSRALQVATQAECDGDWHTAHQAYACAFDIAKLRLHDAERGLLSVFTESQLVHTAQRWVALSGTAAQVQAAADAVWFAYCYIRAKIAAPLTLDRRSDLDRQLKKLAPFIALQASDSHSELAFPKACLTASTQQLH